MRRFDLPLGLAKLFIFRVCAGRRHKSILWINICPKNIYFRSNLIAKIDSAGRVLFVAPEKWSKTTKNHQFSSIFQFARLKAHAAHPVILSCILSGFVRTRGLRLVVTSCECVQQISMKRRCLLRRCLWRRGQSSPVARCWRPLELRFGSLGVNYFDRNRKNTKKILIR